MRPRPVLAVLAAAVVLVLSGCAAQDPAITIAASPPADRAPYRGALAPQTSTGTNGPGAAGEVVRCSTPPFGATAASPYTEGAVARTPEHAIDVALGEGLFLDLPVRSLDRERVAGDRVLFTTSYDGVARQAVIVRNGPARPATGADEDGRGWYVESWARCDVADFPDAVSERAGTHVWSDRAGHRVATTRIVSARGPAHCDWQDMTFLDLDGGMNGRTGGATYVDHPSADLARYFDAVPQARVRLPADAIDTGYARGGRRLWLAADRSEAYVGTRDGVAVWPRAVQPFGCA